MNTNILIQDFCVLGFVTYFNEIQCLSPFADSAASDQVMYM